MSMWITGISAAVSVGTGIYSATQTNKAANKAVDQQKSLLAGLKYEPIDIAKLKAEATASAIENATQSLALERSLTPNVADQRATTDRVKAELARQVESDLALGGNLSPDTINRVNQAGRVIGSSSGIGSPSTVPLTASLLGLSSIDLMNSRRNAANALQGPGALPTVGLDPGSVASAEVADNAANNQFNIAKAGGESNLINSEAKARAAQIGGQTGMVSSLANLLGKGAGAYADSRSGIGDATTYDAFFAGQKPLYAPVDTDYSGMVGASLYDDLLKKTKPMNQNTSLRNAGSRV